LIFRAEDLSSSTSLSREGILSILPKKDLGQHVSPPSPSGIIQTTNMIPQLTYIGILFSGKIIRVSSIYRFLSFIKDFRFLEMNTVPIDFPFPSRTHFNFLEQKCRKGKGVPKWNASRIKIHTHL